MNYRFHTLTAIFVLLLAACLTGTGCRENVLINSKVSPANNADSLYSVTLPIITHTYYQDSTITSTTIGGIPVFEAMGAVLDPYFGVMTAATFFQVSPFTPDTGIYTGMIIDSAVLVLPYSGFTYGSTAVDSQATYQVFYMGDTISQYNDYYNFTNKALDLTAPLSAPTTVNISHLGDSILVSGAHHSGLRIKLNLNILMSHIMPALDIASGTGNPQDFVNNFNGICVRAADNRKVLGAMPYYELDGVDAYSEAGVLVYYHAASLGAVADSDVIENYSFNTGNCAHYNMVSKSYSHYPVNSLVHSTAPNDQVIALQNAPGPNIDVVIPRITSLIPKNVIIAKAEIQFSLLPQSNDTSKFAYPERIYPLGLATSTYRPFGTTYTGEPYTVSDGYPTSSVTPLDVLDGLPHALPQGTSTFTIDLPREVMASIAAGNDTLHYHISGGTDFCGAFHMVAGGGAYGTNGTSDTLYRARVKVVYSKLRH